MEYSECVVGAKIKYVGKTYPSDIIATITNVKTDITKKFIDFYITDVGGYFNTEFAWHEKDLPNWECVDKNQQISYTNKSIKRSYAGGECPCGIISLMCDYHKD